jgi:hypothetical protein
MGARPRPAPRRWRMIRSGNPTLGSTTFKVGTFLSKLRDRG